MASRTETAPAFTEAEGRALTTFARQTVEASMIGSPKPTLDPGLAATRCVGIFVSLKRGHQLRACLGNLSENELAPLGTMIDAAASQVASADVRFPGIHADELPYLSVEVSVMDDLKIVEKSGADRVSEIEIGTHGVIISHPKGRGLLLPQVAVENSCDAARFLDMACAKAGLPDGFWQKPEATLKTFCGSVFESGPVGGLDLEPLDLAESDCETLVKIVQSGFKKQNGEFSVTIELVRPQPTLVGVIVESEDGKNAITLRKGASLIDLVKQATRSLTQENESLEPLSRVSMLSHALVLNPQDDPKRFAKVRAGAALARLGNQIAFVKKSESSDSITAVLKKIGVSLKKWSKSGAEVTVFKTMELVVPTIKQGLIDEPTLSDRGIRLSTAAGNFYPESADAIQTALDNFFFRVPVDASLEECRGIMLPHAGWRYCGDIIAETISRAKIPERIVIISPKHTTLGANWSVSGDAEWQLPNGKVPIDIEGVDFLASKVSDLVVETDAHLEEHGIEVLLPFLMWANPRLKVVPIVIGKSTIAELQPLADALSDWYHEVKNREGRAPLLVISSDMNHFAEDPENRRLDELALERLKAADPEGLFETCEANQISMCGMRPAVAILKALNSEKLCNVEVTRYETSARVTKDISRVVGYAGALLK